MTPNNDFIVFVKAEGQDFEVPAHTNMTVASFLDLCEFLTQIPVKEQHFDIGLENANKFSTLEMLGLQNEPYVVLQSKSTSHFDDDIEVITNSNNEDQMDMHLREEDWQNHSLPNQSRTINESHTFEPRANEEWQDSTRPMSNFPNIPRNHTTQTNLDSWDIHYTNENRPLNNYTHPHLNHNSPSQESQQTYDSWNHEKQESKILFQSILSNIITDDERDKFQMDDFHIAVDLSTKYRKPLFVILYSEARQNSVAQLQSFLFEVDIIRILKENYITWIGAINPQSFHKNDDENYPPNSLHHFLSRFLNSFEMIENMDSALTFLFAQIRNDLILINSRDLESQSSNDIVHLLLTHINDFGANEFSHLTQQSMEQYRHTGRSETERILESQNQGYLESLRADQEKELKRQLQQKIEEEEEVEKRKQEEERQRQEILEKHQVEMQESKRKQEIESAKNFMKELQEPDVSTTQDSVILLRFRLPDGSILQRRFLRTSPLKWIYLYITAEKDNHYDNFTLETHFPKKSYTLEEHGEHTLEDLKLSKMEQFFVASK